MKQNTSGKKKYAGYLWPLLLILAVMVLMSSMAGTPYARYVIEHQKSGAVASPEFYFESNYLRENEGEDGTVIRHYDVYDDHVDIALYNHDGLNYASQDIGYTLHIDGGALAQNGTPVADDDTRLISGTLTGADQKEAVYTLSGTAGTTVHVVAAVQSPFARVLQADFTFHQQHGGLTWKATDEGYYVTLEIWSGQSPEEVTVTCGANLAPDNTEFPDWTSGSSETISMVANAYRCLTFYENTAGNYDGSGTGTTITLGA